MIRPIALGLILSAWGLDAEAQQGADGLQQCDRTGSSTVTLAELRERRAEIFDMFDTDGNGRLDATERLW